MNDHRFENISAEQRGRGGAENWPIQPAHAITSGFCFLGL